MPTLIPTLFHALTTLTGSYRLKRYIGACRTRTALETEPEVPPTMEEIESIMEYLRQEGCKPTIVGSAAIAFHLGPDADTDFRPTSDLDIFVKGVLPPPPVGWRADPQALGVPSWISPTGGHVDFLPAGHEFPGGRKNPSDIGQDTSVSTLPVSDVASIFRLKLNSERNKDLMDLVALARKTGIPETLGKLNAQQRENLDFLRIWLQHRPTGNYGE